MSENKLGMDAAKEYLELRDELGDLENSLNGHECPGEFEPCTLCETYGNKQTQYRGMQKNWSTKWAQMLTEGQHSPGDEQLREAAQALLDKLKAMNIGQKYPEVARLRYALAGKEE